MKLRPSYLTDLHASVQKLIPLGFHIFEAKPNKKPATKNGFKDATNDAEQILSWKPNAMAAKATGEVSRTVVFDLDKDQAKGIDGSSWWAQLEAEHGPLPRHPIALTPRGGTHHYFRYPAGKSVRCTAGKLAAGVDVRANGGYVILSPSRSDAGAYEWLVPPWEVELPEIPESLLSKIADDPSDEPLQPAADDLPTLTEADQESVEREVQRRVDKVRHAKEGTRNATLNQSAYALGQMIAADVLDEDQASQKLFEAAIVAGLTRQEARATIRSGIKAGMRQPWRPYAVEAALFQLNKDHFFAIEGKTAFVFREQIDPNTGNRVLARIFPEAFKQQHNNRFVAMPGSNAPVPLGTAWMKWPHRRQYERVMFRPGQTDDSSIYNCWWGLASDSVDGDCQPFLQYMLEVLCDGDRPNFEYFVRWCARLVQMPWLQGETATVFCGPKGCGKSFFAQHFGQVMGNHYVELTSARHLVGNFNAHLETAILVFADEAYWAGDKQGEATLKALITSPYILVERKGVDARMAPNFVHLMMASNSDWVVPASADERRYFVLKVSPAHMGDHAYFEALDRHWQNGGREAFLHCLLSIDLSNFNVRKVPQTEALLSQKLLSLPVMDRWYLTVLQDGEVRFKGWPDWITTTLLVEALAEFCKSEGARVPTRVQFGMRLAALLPARRDGKTWRCLRQTGPGPDNREWGYELPPMDECRRHFESLMSVEFQWDEPGEVPKGPPSRIF